MLGLNETGLTGRVCGLAVARGAKNAEAARQLVEFKAKAKNTPSVFISAMFVAPEAAVITRPAPNARLASWTATKPVPPEPLVMATVRFGFDHGAPEGEKWP